MVARSQDAETARLSKQAPKKKPVVRSTDAETARLSKPAPAQVRRPDPTPIPVQPAAYEMNVTPTGKLVTIDLFGKRVTVVDSIVPRLKRVEAKWAAMGGHGFYRITDVGGFADRDVRGRPGKKSQHAHGWAVDINVAKNPMGKNLVTDMPPEFVRMWLEEGFGWGGFWKSSKDAMHFSMAESEGGQGRHAVQFLGEQFGPFEVVPFVPHRGVDAHGDESGVDIRGLTVGFVRGAMTSLSPNIYGNVPTDETISFDRVTPDVVNRLYEAFAGRSAKQADIDRWMGVEAQDIGEQIQRDPEVRSFRGAQLGQAFIDRAGRI